MSYLLLGSNLNIVKLKNCHLQNFTRLKELTLGRYCCREAISLHNNASKKFPYENTTS